MRSVPPMTTIFIFLFKCFFVVFCLCPTMICHLFLKVPDAHISEKEEFFRKLDGLSCATNCKSFWGQQGATSCRTVIWSIFMPLSEGGPTEAPIRFVAKLRNFAQIVRLRNQCRKHCRRAVLRFGRRIGRSSWVLRRTG